MNAKQKLLSLIGYASEEDCRILLKFFNEASNESLSVRDNENTKEDLKCVICGNKTDNMYHCNKGYYCQNHVHVTF